MAGPFIGDSRKPRGPGILPLQDWSFRRRGVPLRNRTCLLALRIVDRQTGDGELGHYEAAEDSVGDVTGGYLWRPDGYERDLPPWRFGPFPVRTLTATGGTPGTPSGGATTGGGGSSGGPTSAQGDIAANTRSPGGASYGTGPAPSPGAPTGVSNTGATTGNGPGGASGAASATAEGADYARDAHIQPVRSRSWEIDYRLQRRALGGDVGLPSASGRRWPAIPGGMCGIVTVGTDDESEPAVFCPTDPRLIAAHRGEPGYGSWVCDVTPGGSIDVDSRAPLQSALRVVRQLGRGILSLAGPRRNALAWTFTRSGRRDVLGGLVHDGQALSRLDVSDGGALDCGGTRDKHTLGRDGDNTPCNPAHIPILAFYRGREELFDGPLEFQERIYPSPDPLPFKGRVHLTYQPSMGYRWPQFNPTQTDYGVWRWYCEFTMGTTTPTGRNPTRTPTDTREPQDPPPPPEGDPPTTPGGGGGGGGGGGEGDGPPTSGGGEPGGPTTPDGGGGVGPFDRPPTWWDDEPEGPTTPGGGGGGNDREGEGPVPPWGPTPPPAPGVDPDDIGTWPAPLGGPSYPTQKTVQPVVTFAGSVSREERPQHYTTLETAFPSVVGQATRIDKGEPILLWHPAATDAETRVRTMPATIRTQAFGAQGPYTGLDGAAPADATGWKRTQKAGESAFPGGTAPGGWIDLPPEVSLEDVVYDFAPSNVTVSAALRVIGPGVKFAFGIPDLETGGMSAGWTFEREAGGDLVVKSVASGTSTTRLTFATSGITLTNGYDITVGTAAGTKIGTSASQKLALFGQTPAAQPAAIGNPAGGATIDTQARDAIDDILAALRTLGIIAT